LKDLKAVKEVMRAKGYSTIGYGKLNEQLEKEGKQPIFRIGHMGDITPDMLAAYLKDLDRPCPKLIRGRAARAAPRRGPSPLTPLVSSVTACQAGRKPRVPEFGIAGGELCARQRLLSGSIHEDIGQ
jgi:hypothetical protein